MQLFVLRTVYEAKTNPLVPIATCPVSNLGIMLLALPIIVTKIKFQVSVAMTTTSKPCTLMQIGCTPDLKSDVYCPSYSLPNFMIFPLMPSLQNQSSLLEPPPMGKKWICMGFNG